MRAKLGDIWKWTDDSFQREEYWLITQLPDTGTCIWSNDGTTGSCEEITVNDSYFHTKWTKVA